MNTEQRTLIRAMQHIRTVPRSFDKKFIASMGWLVKHEPRKRLTPKQRYQLQLIAYRYRVQLAGSLDEAMIPTEAPRLEDYVQEKPELQGDMLDGSAKPVVFDEPLTSTKPQRSGGLF